MLRSTNLSHLSPESAVVRKHKTVEAFLSQRVSKEQLCRLMETREEQWEDTFQSLTAVDNDQTGGEFSITPREAVESLGLFQRLDALSENEVWSPEDRAVYRIVNHFSNLRESSSGPSEANRPSTFFQASLEAFSELDRNGDNSLDGGELDLALSGGYFSERAEMANRPETAAVISTLRQKSDLLSMSEPNDGKNLSHLDLLKAQGAETTHLKRIADIVSSTYSDSLARAESLDMSKPLQSESFDPMTIQQGAAGSCVFLSTLVGLEPNAVKSLVHPQEDGSAKVVFADGSEERVPMLTLAERLYHTQAKDQEAWPAVLEIAAAQALYSESSEKFSSLRDAIDGVSPEDAVRLLTGEGIDRRNLDELSVAETRKALEELKSYGGPMLCASRPNALGDFISVEDLHNGIMNSHAYAILGYDSESDLVTLRNPWGHREWNHQDSPDDGVFEMPVRDFYSSFRWMAAANGQKK